MAVPNQVPRTGTPQSQRSGGNQGAVEAGREAEQGGTTVEVTPPTTPKAPPRSAFRVESFDVSTHWLKILLYGEYGVGKTYLAGTSSDVPHMKDVLYVDAEAGGLTLRNFRDRVDRIRITNYQQLARVQEYLRLHCRARDDGNLEQLRSLQSKVMGESLYQPDRVRQYRTVILDSLSELQKFCMYLLTGIQIGQIPLDVPPGTPEWKEWGQSAEMVRLLVRTFRDLPMHVIFVASEMIAEDDRKQHHRRPNLPGKLSGEVQGFLDVVGWYASVPGEEGKMSRRLYLQPGRTFQAKNRFGVQIPYLDNPTMPSLYSLIEP